MLLFIKPARQPTRSPTCCSYQFRIPTFCFLWSRSASPLARQHVACCQILWACHFLSCKPPAWRYSKARPISPQSIAFHENVRQLLHFIEFTTNLSLFTKPDRQPVGTAKPAYHHVAYYQAGPPALQTINLLFLSSRPPYLCLIIKPASQPVGFYRFGQPAPSLLLLIKAARQPVAFIKYSCQPASLSLFVKITNTTCQSLFLIKLVCKSVSLSFEVQLLCQSAIWYIFGLPLSYVLLFRCMCVAVCKLYLWSAWTSPTLANFFVPVHWGTMPRLWYDPGIKPAISGTPGERSTTTTQVVVNLSKKVKLALQHASLYTNRKFTVSLSPFTKLVCRFLSSWPANLSLIMKPACF